MERGRLITCPTCGGTGKITENSPMSFGVKDCPQCKGKGLIMVAPKRRSPINIGV